MWEHDLDDDTYERYMRTLRSSHRIRVRLRIHDQDEKIIGELRATTSQVLSGSVQFDTTADVSRSFEITVLDPEHRLRFQEKSPIEGAIFADKFLSCLYEVWVPDLDSSLAGGQRFGEDSVDFADLSFSSFGGFTAANRQAGQWVVTPVFWGTITSFNRIRAEVTIEAQGKEALAMDPNLVIQSYMIQGGTQLDDAIRKVAAKFGETRFNIPELGSTLLQHSFAVPQKTEPWKVLSGGVKLKAKSAWKAFGPSKGHGSKAQHLSNLKHGLVHRAPGNQTVFYDGEGRLTVRRLRTKKVLVLEWGRDFTSQPEIDYDSLEDFRNCFIVTGKRTKVNKDKQGKKTQSPRRARGRAELAPAHPLSPRSLGRNGVDRHLVTFVETELKTDADCVRRAIELLREGSDMGIEINLECLPIPHLEEHDRIEIRTPWFSVEMPMHQWTLPLSSDSAMSIGQHKNVKRKGGIRRHPMWAPYRAKKKKKKKHHGGHDGHGGHGGHGGHDGHGGHGGHGHNH